MTCSPSKPRRLLRCPGIVISLIAASLVSFSPDLFAESRTLEWEGPSASLSSVTLRAGNGSVAVQGVAEERVLIRVEVSPSGGGDDEPEKRLFSWFLTSQDLSDEELVESIRLQVDPEHERLEVSLQPGGRTRKSRVREKWTIEMPARLGLDVKLDAADVDVIGLLGGVHLRLGNGSVDLDLAGGDVDAKVTVGHLDIHTQGDYGSIQLRSTVGDTDLWVHGLRIDYPDPPGPGSRIRLDGRGEFKARVEVEVGDAELRVD